MDDNQVYKDLLVATNALMPNAASFGIKVFESWRVPQGTGYKTQDGLFMHPADLLTLKYPNHHPKYTLGHAEVRREKRKNARKSELRWRSS